MNEELNETIFQMKNTMDVSFKVLQLNMDNVLKSHVIFKNPSLRKAHTRQTKPLSK